MWLESVHELLDPRFTVPLEYVDAAHISWGDQVVQSVYKLYISYEIVLIGRVLIRAYRLQHLFFQAVNLLPYKSALLAESLLIGACLKLLVWVRHIDLNRFKVVNKDFFVAPTAKEILIFIEVHTLDPLLNTLKFEISIELLVSGQLAVLINLHSYRFTHRVK